MGFKMDKVVQPKEKGDVTGLWDGFVPWTRISWATGHCVCIFCVFKGVLAMQPLLVP